MKLLCTCGHEIIDQTDYLPYKGVILRDQHQFEFFDYIRDTIVDYIQAIREGRRDAWVKGFFGNQSDSAKDYDDSHALGVVNTMILRAMVKWMPVHIYQCRICARLYVEHRVGERDQQKELKEWERWEILEFAPVKHSIQVLEVPGGRVGVDDDGFPLTGNRE